MRRIFYKIWMSAVLLVLSQGCSFLNVDNNGKTDTDTFFRDIEGLRTALNGLYSCAYEFYDGYYLKYAEVTGDYLQSAVSGTGAEMYYQYNFLSRPEQETSSVGYLWKKGYVIVINANTILNYVPELKKKYPNNVGEIMRIEGQALFLRALAHFDLVLCYAQPYGYSAGASHPGIPVAKTVVGANESVGRTSVADVYDRIVSDLREAMRLLGDMSGDTDYVTGIAAEALLARACLYMGEYSEAEIYAGNVMERIRLTPYDGYQAMFTGEEKGSEAIFSLTGKYAGQRMRSFFDYEDPAYVPSPEFVRSFGEKDIRAGLLASPAGDAACMKYYDLKNASPVERYYRIHVLRGSEMYLVRAEARCMTGNLEGAAEDLKALLARAENISVEEITESEVPQSDKDGLMERIKEERKKELCYEGHRFFDIARWGDDLRRPESTNSSVRTLEYPDYRFVLPIPQIEMDVNEAMIQNEGY